MLSCGVIVRQINVLELFWVQIVNILFYLCVHFSPEIFVSIVEFLHQEVEVHDINFLNPLELISNFVQALHNPLMFIPIMLLLPFDLTQISQALYNFLEGKILNIFKAQQYLIRLQSIPMYLLRVVHSQLFF